MSEVTNVQFVKDGGREPTFPFDDGVTNRKGLTKREHFASLAMQSIILTGGSTNVNDNVRLSVEYADKLIYELY